MRILAPVSRRRGLGMLVVSLGLLIATGGSASEVRFLEMMAREDFAAGTLRGVAVGPLGSLSLADRSERVADVDAPFLFAATRHPRGWVVGTGNEGKVLLITEGGETQELFNAPEPEVFAVLADADGTVFAATSPRGKVYRIPGDGGQVETYFDPEETYIWNLARAADGALLLGTGTEGRVYRVTAAGQGQVFFEGDDPHIRSLLALSDGRVLLGTAGQGLIVELRAGEARTLYDGDRPEVVALTADAQGVVFAAAIASEQSVVDATRAAGTQTPAGGEQPSGAQREADESGQGQEAEEGTVTVTAAGAPVPTTRIPFAGARSVILRIEPSGVVHEVETLQQQTVYSLLWSRERLWIGTGLEGHLFSWRGEDLVLEKDVDERQVMALLPGDPGPVFATTNAAAIHRVTAASERAGEYTSAALDAGQLSRFGTLHWEGEQPPGTRVSFSVRTGMSSEPDATWSGWSPAEEGRGVSLAAAPGGRYVQWRAQIEAADGRSPEIRRVTLSYLQENLPPRIRELTALEPGVVMLPAGGGGSGDIVETWRPQQDRIFTGLRSASEERERGRRARRPGFRTLQWTAEDPNQDELRFRLSFRAEESSAWLVMAEDLGQSWFSFDSTILPDGWYRFRLEAFNRPAEEMGAEDEQGLRAERVSVPVLIDNTAPELGTVRHRGGRLEVEVVDALSPLRSARVSVDAARWEAAEAADGMVDSLRETLHVPMPEQATLLLLQVEDAARNVATFDLSRWLE